MPAIKLPAFPSSIWNFAGAYVVWFMTGVSCSACAYTTYHYLKDSPDVEWRKEMRLSELKDNGLTEEKARVHVASSFFRSIANLRDRSIPGGPNEKDTRIFRI